MKMCQQAEWIAKLGLSFLRNSYGKVPKEKVEYGVACLTAKKMCQRAELNKQNVGFDCMRNSYNNVSEGWVKRQNVGLSCVHNSHDNVSKGWVKNKILAKIVCLNSYNNVSKGWVKKLNFGLRCMRSCYDNVSEGWGK